MTGPPPVVTAAVEAAKGAIAQYNAAADRKKQKHTARSVLTKYDELRQAGPGFYISLSDADRLVVFDLVYQSMRAPGAIGTSEPPRLWIVGSRALADAEKGTELGTLVRHAAFVYTKVNMGPVDAQLLENALEFTKSPVNAKLFERDAALFDVQIKPDTKKGKAYTEARTAHRQLSGANEAEPGSLKRAAQATQAKNFADAKFEEAMAEALGGAYVRRVGILENIRTRGSIEERLSAVRRGAASATAARDAADRTHDEVDLSDLIDDSPPGPDGIGSFFGRDSTASRMRRRLERHRRLAEASRIGRLRLSLYTED